MWFDIDSTATGRPDTARPEPALAAAPFLVEFDGPEPLDPGRAEAAPEPDTAKSTPRQRLSVIGLVGSIGVHLLPLLALLSWPSAPAEIAFPVAVQLVLEKPAPSSEEKPPPPGRLASEDIGESGPEAKPAADAAAAAQAPAPARPAEAQLAALVPPPPPKPVPPAKPALVAPVIRPLQPAPRKAPVPGPAATRDEYLAYLVTLTRRHFDLLPLSFIGNRRGETIIAILVLDDGTIARIAVAHSSGYPDIDARIEQMVAAVRRFPPLPQWFQGPRVELNLRLRFPEALQE